MKMCWSFLAFLSVVGFSMIWNAIGGACQTAPAPAPAPSTNLNMASSPSYSYLPYEADAVHAMLSSWNDSGTNVSTLMPSWSSERIHPCNSTAFIGVSSKWITCSNLLVHITNLTSYDYTLTSMSINGPDYGGSVAITGVVPSSILNLTNLLELAIVGHRKLSGPLPMDILNKALPSITSISFRGCNLSGNITLSSTSPKLVQLATLDLSDNSFTGSTPFCQNARQYSLSSLNLSNNHLTGTFCNNESAVLKSLDISNNQFTDVFVRKDAFLLQFLYARHNLIQTFPTQLLKLPRLQQVYFDSNNISGVLVLPNVFASNSSLRLISLINNNITGLLPSNESSSLLSKSNLQRLELLFLGGNPVCKDSRKNAMLRMVCRFNRTSSLDDLENNSNKAAIIISVCMGGFVLVVLILSLFIIKKLMKKIYLMRGFLDELDKKDIKPNLYSFTELKVATRDFQSNNELGRGGFGVVYKGVLIDGTKVAVKRLLKAKKEQDIQDFLNEIIVISNIKHRNLVQLKGCCITGDQRILVYELVDNKNLASILWGDPGEDHLDWGSRFNIILGIARGLAYLHEEIEPPIIHRDIKGQNILLDKDLNPKIADFGLALLLPSLDDGETHMNISRVAGTMGYLAPEYATYGQVSTKVDVFSFGVLILEIVSGRRNIASNLPTEQLCLTLWAQRLHIKNQTMELVDKSLQEVTMAEEATIKKVVEIGLFCLHHIAARRPTVSDIVAMLVGNKEIDHGELHEYHLSYVEEDVSSSSPSLPLFSSSNQSRV